MNNCDARWIALLFDTEGHFSLNKTSALKSDRPPKRGFNWTLHAGVINTSRVLLEEVQKISGNKGRLSKHGSEYYRPSNKPLYTWNLRREEMMEVFPVIIPYLIVKKEQADLLLEAAESFEICKGLGPNPITPFRDRRLETIFWRMRLLNAKTKDGAVMVSFEEKAAGHIPYSEEEFLRDAKKVREEQDIQNYRNQLKTAREWKRRNPEKVKAYWREWYAKEKLKSEVLSDE